MNGGSELRINRIARPDVAQPIRHAVASFLSASGCVDDDVSDDILTAIGEALANAVEHAYAGVEENAVEIFARLENNETLAVDVFDRGTFIKREPQLNRGYGMIIVRAIAQTVTVDVNDGTHVHMVFNLTK